MCRTGSPTTIICQCQRHPLSVSVPPVMGHHETEIRQWHKCEGYPPAPTSYPGMDVERERARRYPETHEWHDDAYRREREPCGSDLNTYA